MKTVDLNWKRHERVRVFQYIHKMLTTQRCPSISDASLVLFTTLGSINRTSTHRVAATCIQRAYLSHLYHPEHAWHQRCAENACAALCARAWPPLTATSPA